MFQRIPFYFKQIQLLLSRLTLRQQLVFTGVIVGVTSGASAFIFERLIQFFSWIPVGLSRYIPLHGMQCIFVLTPALGGLIAGIITHRYCAEAKGHGVLEVISAINNRQGHIETRVFWAKSVASAATIGSGGSAGSEGPIVQIGATVGSSLGRWMRISGEDLKTLAAAGATGGLAAAFSIPLAGVFFTMEVILKNFANEAFPAVVISSVTAAATSRLLLGNEAFFTPHHYQWQHPAEFIYYSLLGLFCAPLGLFYMKTIDVFESWFSKLSSIPDWLRPACGGLMVGFVTLILPQTRGAGKPIINAVVAGNITGWILISMLTGKIIATSLTLGSGGSGGSLMPSLFVGAAGGAIFGSLIGVLHLPPVAIGGMALVGMACVFTASFQAPITAIIMTLEITRDYEILMPVMLGCIITLLASRTLSTSSQREKSAS